MSGFRGLPPALFRFLEGVAKDNSKTYWEGNRLTWEEHVRGSMKA